MLIHNLWSDCLYSKLKQIGCCSFVVAQRSPLLIVAIAPLNSSFHILRSPSTLNR
ncbi:MAG: hypothetical protein F6K16_36405 [Symploca sp. SIO2B6]|nr:hypothetical protein [Symploca sp. SIO2B6]